MKPVRLAPGAAEELDEATEWYESRQAGLGSRFLEEIDQTLEQIRRNPLAYPCLRDFSKELDIRRALMLRFPYGIVFLELPSDFRVLAVAHAKRRPGYWLQRLRRGGLTGL